MRTKIIIILCLCLPALFTLRVHSTDYGLHFPCACGSVDMLVRADMHELNDLLQLMYQDADSYPSYATLRTAVTDQQLLVELHNYDELLAGSQPKPGVYYAVDQDMHTYHLYGYATGEVRQGFVLYFLGHELFRIGKATSQVFPVDATDVTFDVL
ncbi:MAG TPA: hypothetical protein PKL83_00890 [bacterium]|nr:hypothetical protein [bacterium]